LGGRDDSRSCAAGDASRSLAMKMPRPDVATLLPETAVLTNLVAESPTLSAVEAEGEFDDAAGAASCCSVVGVAEINCDRAVCRLPAAALVAWTMAPDWAASPAGLVVDCG
jgi:hypothetical protein